MDNPSKTQWDEVDQMLSEQLADVDLARAIPKPDARGEPSDDQLLRLLAKAGSSAELAEIETAVRQSPYSQARLAILRDVLEEQPPSETSASRSLVARLAFLVNRGADSALRFIRGNIAPLPLPLPQPTRGQTHTSSDTQAQCYRFEHAFAACDSALEIECYEGRLTLRIELSVDNKPMEFGRVSLLRDGQLVEASGLAQGRVNFENLAPGRYLAEITQGDSTLARLKLDLLE